MRILEGVGTLIQLSGLVARLCKMVSLIHFCSLWSCSEFLLEYETRAFSNLISTFMFVLPHSAIRTILQTAVICCYVGSRHKMSMTNVQSRYLKSVHQYRVSVQTVHLLSTDDARIPFIGMLYPISLNFRTFWSTQFTGIICLLLGF